MKNWITAAVVCLGLGVPAHAATIIAVTPDEYTSIDVAQVAGHLEFRHMLVSGQMTSVYRGGVAAPFGIFLTVWDPEPTEGGDFGTVQTFDLGTFSNLPTIQKITIRKLTTSSDLTLEIEFTTAMPNEDFTGSSPVSFRLSAQVKNGLVEKTLKVEEI